MEKFKQHYEKIILGVLSLGFILALIYLLQMVESANNITEDELKFSAPAKRYEELDFQSKDYSVDELLGKLSVWSQRDNTEAMGFTAELIVPMQSLRCENTTCRKILPWAIAKTKKVCPHCGEKLDDPGDPPDYEKTVANLDSDSDGMPDRYELKMGFNPLEDSDADQDKDNDGFSNLYEYMVKTDPLSAKSYPSLEKCLMLVKLDRVAMPIKLIDLLTVVDKSNPRGYKVLEVDVMLNGRRQSLKIGEVFSIGTREFKVLDAELKTGDAQAASVVLDSNDSEMIIAPVSGGKVDEANKIVLKVNTDVYEPQQRAHIRDVRNPGSKNGNFRVNINDTFSVTAEEKNKIVFQVVSIDAASETVVVLNTDTQEEFMLKKGARIPKNAYVSRENRNAGSISTPSALDSLNQPAPRRKQRSRRN